MGALSGRFGSLAHDLDRDMLGIPLGTARNLSMTALANALGLASWPGDEAFLADLGQPPENGDRYFNTTSKRIRIWHTGQFVTVGGQT